MIPSLYTSSNDAGGAYGAVDPLQQLIRLLHGIGFQSGAFGSGIGSGANFGGNFTGGGFGGVNDDPNGFSTSPTTGAGPS